MEIVVQLVILLGNFFRVVKPIIFISKKNRISSLPSKFVKKAWWDFKLNLPFEGPKNKSMLFSKWIMIVKFMEVWPNFETLET